MIYILILPVLEELAAVIIQALEILKGKAMLTAQIIQKQLTELAKSTEEDAKQITHVIGFQIPNEPEEYDEDEEDQDEDE